MTSQPPFALQAKTPKVVLCIGIGPLAAEAMAHAQHPDALAVSRPYSALTPHLIRELQPKTILAPLFGSGFDAGQVVQRLQASGYHGAVLVLCPRLPNPDMVLRELTLLAPSVQIELICTPQA